MLAKTIDRVLLLSVWVIIHQSAWSQVNVLTNRYDNGRTGANLQETVLNTTNVNVNQFGKLYSYQVDGAMYAQPLYVSGLTVAGVKHNVLYVATMNDKVYAFDADQAGSALWSRDLTDPANGVTAVPISDLVGSNSYNIVGNVGVESTPAIDLSSNTIYLVARTKENGTYVQRLHAIDILSGSEKPNSPVLISASVKGTAPDAVNGVLTFDPKMHNQRPSLALVNGVVLITWASHEDDAPFHGWIIGYNAATLQQVGVLCTTPNGRDGGIWQSGRAPVIDPAGYVYYQTGNGDWDGQTNFGDSVIKLQVNTSGLSIVDWFTPDDQSVLNQNDTDLGSTGAMLIPGTNVLIGGGKESVLYLLNATNLGHFASNNSQVIQSVNVNGGEMKGGPAFWNGPAGPLIYTWAQTDYLKAFHFNGTTLDSGTFATSSMISPGSPGGALTVSANGASAGTGIVWATLSANQDGDHGTVAGILRAFNAQNLQELWNSELLPSRDSLGTLVKFVPPLVVNGRVYAVTYDNALMVYGLLPNTTTSPDFNLTAGNMSVQAGGTADDYVGVSFINGFSGTVALSVSGLPAGASATFAPASVSASSTSTLQISTSSSTAPGTYPLSITGISGSTTHSVTAQFTVSSTPLPPAKAISIDFVGLDTPMQTSEVAGVVAKANWNTASGAASSQALVLKDENGTTTSASVAWSSDDAWQTPITDTPGNARMMKGYLDTGKGDATVVTVSGLPASSTGYNVYVYIDGDNGSATRTGIYQISGTGIMTTSISATDPSGTNFSGSFQQANSSSGNYVMFTIQASAFTLTATPGATTDSYRRAPLNGIQIVPVSAASNPNPSPSPNPTTISIDFVGVDTPMQPSEVAGIVAKANWNSASGAASSQPLALHDENGNTTAAAITWSSDNTWRTPITDAPGNARMMKGYLDTGKGDASVVTVTGLPVSSTGYNVYVYIDGDNPGATRTGSYQISGSGITTTSISATDPASTNFSGSFQQANGSSGNYVMFTIHATAFTLTATPGATTDSYPRAPINGLQIVPAP
jgi:hypothetical protein